jgi:hypothetical protein
MAAFQRVHGNIGDPLKVEIEQAELDSFLHQR